MSNADKMLNDLNYMLDVNDDNYINYLNRYEKYSIRFYKLTKRFNKVTHNSNISQPINIKENNAIQLKLKELGWLDD